MQEKQSQLYLGGKELLVVINEVFLGFSFDDILRSSSQLVIQNKLLARQQSYHCTNIR